MTASARENVLNAFKHEPAVTVILISLKAGGVALNLTVASHIYLMDPWWNPAAEYQAIDRAHRLGQHKPIRAVRFVVRNTVEERILRLQANSHAGLTRAPSPEAHPHPPHTAKPSTTTLKRH